MQECARISIMQISDFEKHMRAKSDGRKNSSSTTSEMHSPPLISRRMQIWKIFIMDDVEHALAFELSHTRAPRGMSDGY